MDTKSDKFSFVAHFRMIKWTFDHQNSCIDAYEVWIWYQESWKYHNRTEDIRETVVKLASLEGGRWLRVSEQGRKITEVDLCGGWVCSYIVCSDGLYDSGVVVYKLY